MKKRGKRGRGRGLGDRMSGGEVGAGPRLSLYGRNRGCSREMYTEVGSASHTLAA